MLSSLRFSQISSFDLLNTLLFLTSSSLVVSWSLSCVTFYLIMFTLEKATGGLIRLGIVLPFSG
jgi:hypothetical protein